MGRISSTIRITIGLACLAVTVLLCAQAIGLVPDQDAAVMEGRAGLCETAAIHCSLLASRDDVQAIEKSLEAVLQRNPEIVFAVVRRHNGPVVVEVGNGAGSGNGASSPESAGTRMAVPITAGNQPWGSIEIGFRPLARSGVIGYLDHALVRLTLFVAVASFLVYFLYLGRLLQDLDPSRVIPERVRATLDTFAEGLLVMDQKERIVLANRSFAETVGQSTSDLQGCRVSELAWVGHEGGKTPESYPWQQAINEGRSQVGRILGLQPVKGVEPRTFRVNSSPIRGDEGETRGALASFDDVTVVEKGRVELQETLEMLRASRDEIRKKNHELERLANHDPLTSCLNRRSFFEQFETHWKNASRHGYPLAYVMVDIDHFKSVNDVHGHRVGDEVLRKVASVLRASARLGDVVCRYGGEEFGILLPHSNIDEAAQAAERHRRAISETTICNLAVTASFGVTEVSFGAATFHELIDQADKCLYVAKNNGRNQVCRWDSMPDGVGVGETVISSAVPPDDCDIAIPFHAVTALISALSYRDTGTAEHSRRVADLCVAVAGGCMSVGEAYVLETAALLHDIGKMGVPDSILLKPGPLTDEEWQVMRIHDRIGVEIIKSAFACLELTEIINAHHAWFNGSSRNTQLPAGHNIPLGARILAIVDAYDAITSDRVYRAGRSADEAFAELRRCSGTQFDPELVETFIECVLARDDSRGGGTPAVSKQTALRIGLQIESLAGAMDSHDIEGLAAQAERLKKTAAKYGVPSIADAARHLEELAKEGSDQVKLAVPMNDLLDLCRSTQSAYLGGSNNVLGEAVSNVN